MPIAKITGQGLAAMALSVALLWACFITERLTMQRASVEQARILLEIRQMRHTNSQHRLGFAPRVTQAS